MKKDNFSKEIADYMLWPLRLRSFIQGMEDIPQQQTTSKGCSHLGEWLNEDGLTKFGSIPEVKELNEVHIEIHQSINRLVQLKMDGYITDAKRELKKIDPMTKKIIHLLTSIERKID